MNIVKKQKRLPPPVDRESAENYLRQVISKWKNFGKSHKRIIKAIEILLKEK